MCINVTNGNHGHPRNDHQPRHARVPRTLVALAAAWSLAVPTEAHPDTPAFDAASWQAPYQLAVPPGWQSERFALPIGFAPQIPYRGVEDIRFAPGWSKASSDEYWSYAFLWYLDGAQRPSAKTLATHLQTYFDGLVVANSGADAGDATAKALFTTKTSASLRKVVPGKGDAATYRGTVNTRNYMTQAPLTLHAMIHVKRCPGSNKTFLFFKLSPKPFAHMVWQGLHALWAGFACTRVQIRPARSS